MALVPEKEHDSGTSTPDPNLEHHHHHHGHRLLHFVRPDGRHVHIANTPEHHKQLHEELQHQYTNERFDVYLSGTPEHISAVRELHAHHAQRRDTLRETHGAVYNEFENVKHELDRLNAEIHMLTDHGVALDANFSKYGYSAHLRTKDDSEENSMMGDDNHSSIKKHEDRSTEALKFWRRPTIRQYFHKGLLWRSSAKGEVFSFELFMDLIYVGVIGIVGDKTAENPTGRNLVEYIILMCISYKIWNDATMIVNWFDIDDISQRLSVLFYIVFLFAFATNIVYAWETTYTPLVAFYIGQQLFKANWFLWVAYLLPNIAGTLIYFTISTYVTAALWIGSIHVPYPAQIALIVPAIAIDVFGASILIFIMRQQKDTAIGRFGKKYLDFYPAINIEHRVERTNAFISLVFGYSVLTILFQNRDSMPMHAFLGKGILGLIQAFAFNWLYFEIDGYMIHVHAIRRHWLSSMGWIAAHLPLAQGYVLAAATLSHLVLAHDCVGSDPETLGEAYIDKSEAEISDGIRWYYCGGIGVALIGMAAISFAHQHKKLKNPRLKKRPRLVIRVMAGVAIIFLPLAKSLTSLALIAITTSLLCLVLLLDLYGNSCEGDRFWSGGFCDEEKRKCKYSAQVRMGRNRRKEVENALHRGDKVSLADLLRRSSSMTSLESGDSGRHNAWAGGHF